MKFWWKGETSVKQQRLSTAVSLLWLLPVWIPAAKVGVSGVTPVRTLACSHSGTATLECLGTAILELNLKLVGHILFQFNYLKLKIWAGVYCKDCNVVLGHSIAIFGYFNLVLGDSNTIFGCFTHWCIFYLNDEVMEEYGWNWFLPVQFCKIHPFLCAHFQEIVLVLFLFFQQFLVAFSVVLMCENTFHV